MLTPEPKAVYPVQKKTVVYRLEEFQCSPLSRRLCTRWLERVMLDAAQISVLTPEPKAVYRLRLHIIKRQSRYFSAHP